MHIYIDRTAVKNRIVDKWFGWCFCGFFGTLICAMVVRTPLHSAPLLLADAKVENVLLIAMITCAFSGITTDRSLFLCSLMNMIINLIWSSSTLPRKVPLTQYAMYLCLHFAILGMSHIDFENWYFFTVFSAFVKQTCR